MEYLEGETLADRLKRRARSRSIRPCATAIEIADALDKAHRQGIVHRDLKPGNVMLTKRARSCWTSAWPSCAHPRSGLGRLELSALPTRRQAPDRGRQIVGTFQYMAPEQLEGKEPDARADIFAFGR